MNFDHKQLVTAVWLSCWCDSRVSDVNRQAATASSKTGLMCACSDPDDTDIFPKPSRPWKWCFRMNNEFLDDSGLETNPTFSFKFQEIEEWKCLG